MAACVLAACDGVGRAEGYFPLAAGHRWEYDQRIEWENHVVEHETLVLSTEGRESAPGLDGGPAWRRRSASGVDYWLRSDETGTYRVAMKSDLEAQARPDPARRYVLKAPFAVGTQWQATTTAYLLRRRQEFPREIRHTHPAVPMAYVIEAVGEHVATRAGRFDECLRVRGEAKLRLFADPVQGWRDLPLTTLEWYCKGVGLVRLERDEPATSTFLSGGKLVLELMSWR
ncbi:MAG: hypothetical protein HZC37_08490 [Burkholderiales bacterium]|nr:hypothetical protein [Burkholderiales bacterium]